MSAAHFLPLPDRAVLRIAGADARSFLQGLISNDVTHVTPDTAIWAAFLTAQGRYLHDFFIVDSEGSLLLDAEAARLPDLQRRLSIYRLRSRVTIEPASDLGVFAMPGAAGITTAALPDGRAGAAAAYKGGVLFVDPRHVGMGARALLPLAEAAELLAERGFCPADATARDAYERLRIRLGLPDGSRDMLIEKTLLLECGFDELNGVDWKKGCYLGQELTARTRYRGLIKRRLIPVEVDGPMPEPGTPFVVAGKDAGEVRSSAEGYALALVRLEALEWLAANPDERIVVNGATLRPCPPAWLQLQPEGPSGSTTSSN